LEEQSHRLTSDLLEELERLGQEPKQTRFWISSRRSYRNGLLQTPRKTETT